MITFARYINRAVDGENLNALLAQRQQVLFEPDNLTCTCGVRLTLASAYRCLYCGIYRCAKCAEEHFGQTFEQWAATHKPEQKPERTNETEPVNYRNLR